MTADSAVRVLIVDDIAANRGLLAACLREEGYEVRFASDGQAALEHFKDHNPDVVILDVMMPRISGIEVCRLLKQTPETRLVPVILATALTDLNSRICGIEAGADDFISKPFHAPELRARVRSLVRVKRFTDELDTAEAVLVSLGLTIEARDPYTNGHCQRLARYAVALGRRIGLGEDDLTALSRGAYLHDIGKVGLPDSILLKSGKLSVSEYEQMKQHTVVGDHLCSRLRLLRRIRPIVRHHHERLNGSGYPDGLMGDAVPLLAQITAVVDVFDALTTERPYKSASTREQALVELMHEVDVGLHRRDLVETFAAVLKQGLDVEEPDGELDAALRMPTSPSGRVSRMTLVARADQPRMAAAPGEPEVLHRVKNHMGVVMGFTELLLQGAATVEQKADLEAIRTAAAEALALMPGVEQLSSESTPPVKTCGKDQ